MPAKDHYHDIVVRALQKDGWRIQTEQALLGLEERHIWIDIEAFKGIVSNTILVEVKGFEQPSQVEELMVAVGKYVVYRGVIDIFTGKHIPLYLAVPKKAYEGILTERIGKMARRRARIKCLIFDPETEEIVGWTPGRL